MSSLVVDCSAIISSVLPDENQSFLGYRDYKIYVPAIFYLECNNILLSAKNKNRIDISEYRKYIEVLQNLPIILDKFSSISESIYFIAELASKNNLTTYDASYLELALRLDATIATFDKVLIKACKDHNINILNE